MFNAASNAFIDGVSDFKLEFVDLTVDHDGIKNTLNAFVEAQRQYTKSAAAAGMQSMISLSMLFTSKSFYDYATAQVKSLVPDVPAYTAATAKAKARKAK